MWASFNNYKRVLGECSGTTYINKSTTKKLSGKETMISQHNILTSQVDGLFRQPSPHRHPKEILRFLTLAGIGGS